MPHMQFLLLALACMHARAAAAVSSCGTGGPTLDVAAEEATLLVCPPGGDAGVVQFGGTLSNAKLNALLDDLRIELAAANRRVDLAQSVLQALRTQVCAARGGGPELGCGTCALSPCANGGTCANGVATGLFSCACAPGFAGTTCQTNIDECASAPCQNGGSCTDGINRFKCACTAGYTGSTCQVRLASCSPTEPCSNGGTCFNSACTCPAGSGGVTCSSTGALQWVRQAGSAADDDGVGVAVDDAGRVLVLGKVAGSADGQAFGGASDVLLMVFNSTGTRLWSRSVSNTAASYAGGVAPDSAGNVYVTGYTFGPLDGQSVAGESDVFLACFNSSGSRMWTRLLGSNKNDEAYSIAVDAASNPWDTVFVCGTTAGVLPSLAAAGFGGFRDAFVARYASNGTREWVRQFGSTGEDYCRSVALFQSEVYVTGTTTGIMSGLASMGSRDIFVAKITAQGTVAWTTQLGTAGSDEGRGIAVDSSGVFVTGFAAGSLGGQTSIGGWDVFVARYSHAGVMAWMRLLGTSSDDFGFSVALDQGGSVLVTGQTQGALNGLVNAGGDDAFVASFASSSGALQWTRLVGSQLDNLGRSVAVDVSSGTACVVGSTSGAVLAGQPAFGGFDLFVLKIK